MQMHKDPAFQIHGYSLQVTIIRANVFQNALQKDMKSIVKGPYYHIVR